jgi:proteasome lid subunit RPN8/RPN11
MIILATSQVDDLFAHAGEAAPGECCGLIGGEENGKARNIYRLRNVAGNREVAYEAAPEELFAAQREMRRRGERLLAIYHSHPRSPQPAPSETDVRLAYYPSAVYLIIGLGGSKPALSAFRISEQQQRWEQVEYTIMGE